jgi:cysteine desulfurase
MPFDAIQHHLIPGLRRFLWRYSLYPQRFYRRSNPWQTLWQTLISVPPGGSVVPSEVFWLFGALDILWNYPHANAIQYAYGGNNLENVIYADNSATTFMSETALQAMLPFFRENFGNPSAIYSYGQSAKKALEDSRRKVANSIGAYNNEIYFTSGGTESDNWAIHCACELNSARGKHIIASAFEHSAVLRTLEKLAAKGYETTLLRPDRNGQITPQQLEQAIRPDTILVSVMMANNVVGTILPIKELCSIAHRHKVIFHTDAVQAAAHIPVDVRHLGIDMLSLSAHKFHGPKGVGALFSKISFPLKPYITGGGQEKGQRSGTENVAGIVGMAAAMEEETAALESNMNYVKKLRDKLIEHALKIPGAYLTGDPEKRLPGHASFVFEGIEHSSYIINELNDTGICASSGSACSAASKEAPHVLLAMGYDEEISASSLRISLSHYNTEKEIDLINKALPPVVDKIRRKKDKNA